MTPNRVICRIFEVIQAHGKGNRETEERHAIQFPKGPGDITPVGECPGSIEIQTHYRESILDGDLCDLSERFPV